MSFSLKDAEDRGFYLVHEVENLVRFERVHAAGTQRIEGETQEGALAKIEDFISKFPGVFGHTPSRSDGAIESRDVQAAQSAAAGTPGPAPAADAAAAAPAPAEPTVDTTGLDADAPGEVATGRADVPAEPAAEPAPEGTVPS